MGEVLRDDRRREQLAVGHDRVVVRLGLLGAVDRPGDVALQLGEERVDALQPHGSMPQIVDDVGMVGAQRRDLLRDERPIVLLQPLENPLEGIGGLAHRRNDDEQIALVADEPVQVAHPVGIAHRRTSEFIDFHLLSLMNLTDILSRRHFTAS